MILMLSNSWTANQQKKTCPHMGHNSWHYSNIEGKGYLGFQCLAINVESWLKICTSYQVYGQIWQNLSRDDSAGIEGRKMIKR